ncbi:Erythromycin esterase [Deinococcus proteolyticus MRP]|uniref:Erythromycin esterase n=1 Tax=Deinococcus proteolyticus (strain ATCC 35074 / DSM 20540 / JCM 6276 / NBRC 101906 / NCIMB 13154 / VKM Ac-1939 / CCM 2703 / MRP) TaxID=693977 RepID=F0RJ41_DEIPM|nr:MULTISPECIES: erythromycin esterase family protein [Deinococcus]ADY25449.1 Erythromycin esterase [Deinococcus proteolyticus MRP]MCY1701571.1 erythromycin esterase family protein [Deinococcus sp. SL84]
MNKITLPTLIVTACLSSAQAQAGANSLPAGLAAQYAALVDATRTLDAPAYAALLTDDFSMVMPDGTRLNRDTYLSSFDPEQLSYQKLDYRIDGAEVNGDVARVQFWNRAEAIYHIGEVQQPVTVEARSEDLWRKVNGQWRMSESRALELVTEMSGQVTRQVAQAPLDPATLDARRAALTPLLRPISATDMKAPAADFAWLSELTPGTRVLGLGEGSHGTAEHFALKGRIFRELAEQHGYTVFMIEADYDDAYAIDRWVQGEGSQSAEQITREYDFWTWKTQEMAELLRWMREYNAGRGDKPALRVAGMDMQDPAGSLDLLARLAPAGSRLAGLTGQLLAEVMAQEEREKPDWTRAEALAALLELHARFQPQGTPHAPELRHLARTVQQGMAMLAGMEGDDFNASNALRDRAMADNTQALLRELFPGQKAAVWAHNFHVSKVPAQGQAYANLGSHLAREMGSEYRVIGFSFGGGELRAVPGRADGWVGREPVILKVPDAQPESLDGLSASILGASVPAAFLNVAQAGAQTPLREWFAQPVRISGVGAVYVEGLPTNGPADLPAAFDGLILTPRSSAAVPLPVLEK